MSRKPRTTTAALALMALVLGGPTVAVAVDAPAPTPVLAPLHPTLPGDNFEVVASNATRTSDVTTLLAPFFDRCDQEKRDIDRSRCAVSQAYLRRVLPARVYSITTDDPAVITVSDYDASIRGYRVGLSGCIACTTPVAVGRAGKRGLITVGVPKGGETVAASVEITRGTVGFETLPEAKRWLAEVRPTLRAELVFRPADKEWTFGATQGYALELMAGRVYNRCTGEIVVSTPPSKGQADRPAPGREQEDPACAPRKPVAAAESAATASRPGGAVGAGAPDEPLPSELSKTAIADSMGQIRAQVFACYQKYDVPGSVQLTYEVASNGTVQSLHLDGSLDGTPTGACVLEAAKNAHFPPFQAATQKFTYPFFLRK